MLEPCRSSMREARNQSVDKTLLSEMTWEEVKEAVADRRIAVVPVGATEQHGRHLPVDTDTFLCESVIREVARRFEKLVVCPTFPYGNSTHHLSFAGTISLGPHAFIDAVADILLSLGRCGFHKMLLLNGHGGNRAHLSVAARLARDRSSTPLLTAVADYYNFGARSVAREVRETGVGGMAHACEYETSLYLHFNPEKVRMDRAVKRIPVSPIPEYVHADLLGDSAVGLVVSEGEPCEEARAYSYCDSGVAGDPTVASADKGGRIFELVVADLTGFLERFYQI